MSMKVNAAVEKEIRRRRTFAIISHPDAGKTTLTEKLLYHGGVIHETGEVKGKAGSKSTTSDWMELEKQKGISITSSVMTFDFENLKVNLLDTPGHKDFSEDTYRVLMAVDSACMLIDVAKGVEDRTRKLYEVCRLRQIPIMTFVNKLDREGKAPLDLIDEVEKTLQMNCYPLTWPIGIGSRFKGIFNRVTRKVNLYDQRREGDEVQIFDFDDPSWQDQVHPEIMGQLLQELELVEGVLPPFDALAFLRGELSPVTFGSAKQNFGVDTFLKFFSQYAPEPQKRALQKDQQIEPLEDVFSGFVFKVQANMDRKHRDRMAFVRICSGQFDRGMKIQHARSGRELKISSSKIFVAQDRETVDTAYAGDIIGINDSGHFAIGDSMSSNGKIIFESIPRFAPEIFAKVSIKDALRRRKMQEALQHLAEEGAVQIFTHPFVGIQDPILGVVGELQFEVLLYRLQDEYNLEAKLQRLSLSVARWPQNSQGEPVASLKGNFTIYRDLADCPVILLDQEWDLNWAQKENPNVEFKTSMNFSPGKN